MKPHALAFLVFLGGISAGTAQETPKRFTARELFYSATQSAPPAPPAPKPVATKKKATQAASKPKPAPVPATSATQTATAAPAPDGSHVIPVSANMTAAAPAAGPALGMRYTILKLIGGEMVAVAPDTVFHAGDRIQVNVETNGPGFLYIVSQGSSGT